MTNFKNKIALVTGAATGIGRATAILLAAKGAKVMVTDVNETEGRNTIQLIEEQGGQAVFHLLDVSNKTQVDEVTAAIVATEGSLDLAVNNAGIGGKVAPLHELPLEDWNKMMDINLSGVFYCMQAQIKAMLAQGSGRMVNVSSLAGVGGMSRGSSYSAAKHGVIGLSKSAAIEYGQANIRINVVCPGFTETAIIDQVPDKVLDFTVKTRVPLKRLGKPEEIAKGIAWLLSDDSSFVTGHCMFLDGGMKAG